MAGTISFFASNLSAVHFPFSSVRCRCGVTQPATSYNVNLNNIMSAKRKLDEAQESSGTDTSNARGKYCKAEAASSTRPRPSCPICRLTMPIHKNEQYYLPCCGRSICIGCEEEDDEKYEEDWERRNIAAARAAECELLSGAKNGFHATVSRGPHKCPLCNENFHADDDQFNERIDKRIILGDGAAMAIRAFSIFDGNCNQQKDQAKSFEMFQRAYEMGDVHSAWHMGMSYYHGQGVEKSMEKSNEILLEGAEKGDIMCRFRLAVGVGSTESFTSAMYHFGIAARAGHEEALGAMEQGRHDGFCTREEYDEVEQACRRAQSDMKSSAREKAKRSRGNE